jgi:hypothetical protein
MFMSASSAPDHEQVLPKLIGKAILWHARKWIHMHPRIAHRCTSFDRLFRSLRGLARKLKAVDHPIQAWHLTGVQAAGGGVQLDSVWAPPLIVTWAGHVSTGVHSFVLFTLVVVDGRKTLGYPLGAISDYIAMLTLSQVRLIDGCGELPSILDLMASACKREKPRSITAADLAFLRALNTPLGLVA